MKKEGIKYIMEKTKDTFMAIFGTAVLILPLVALLISLWVGFSQEEQKKLKNENENVIENYEDYYKVDDIVSLYRDNQVDGLGVFAFAIGVGTVKTKNCYFYYTVKNDFYSLEHVNIDNCQILMTNDIKPCLAKTRNGVYKTKKYLLIVPIGTIEEKFAG